MSSSLPPVSHLLPIVPPLPTSQSSSSIIICRGLLIAAFFQKTNADTIKPINSAMDAKEAAVKKEIETGLIRDLFADTEGYCSDVDAMLELIAAVARDLRPDGRLGAADELHRMVQAMKDQVIELVPLSYSLYHDLITHTEPLSYTLALKE